MESVATAIVVVLVLVVLGGAALLLRERLAAQKAVLTDFAEANGLRVRGRRGSPELLVNGQLRHHTVHLSTEWERTGSERHLVTTVRVDVGRRLPFRFRLTPERLGGGAGGPPGQWHPASVENDLESDVVEQGRDPEVRALLRDTHLRGALLRWFNKWPEGAVDDDEIVIRWRGSSSELSVKALRDGVRLAEAFVNALDRQVVTEEDEARTPGSLPVRARVPGGAPEATLAAWLVQVGDEVDRGQPICELMTGLGTLPVEATTAGEVVRIVGEPGRVVTNGSLLIEIEAATGEHLPALPRPPNPSGLELLDLDQVELHRVDEVRAARGPRLDKDSPRPPRTPEPPAGAPPVEPRHGSIDPSLRASFASVSLTALAASLSEPGLLSSQREALLSPAKGTLFELELAITEVVWSAGLSLPEPLQRGRTVGGHLDGGAPAVVVRMPPSVNPRLDALPTDGSEWLAVVGRLRDWDPLRQRLVFDAVDETVTEPRSTT